MGRTPVWWAGADAQAVGHRTCHAAGMPSDASQDPAATDLQAVRQLLADLRQQLTATLDDLDARVDAALAAEPAQARAYSRPAPVPPRRMEQMTRTPEPTADLDDLVDVLAPRLLERLVPGLRDALREDV